MTETPAGSNPTNSGGGAELPETTEYMLTEKDKATLDNNFTYHSPIKDQNRRYVLLRQAEKELAVLISRMVPPSRERSLAITKLEECMMWANAGIARNEKA